MRRDLNPRRKQDKGRRKQDQYQRTSNHPWVKCDSQKMGYRTWLEADFAATLSNMYFYDCPKCSDFHLTESKQKKPPRR